MKRCASPNSNNQDLENLNKSIRRLTLPEAAEAGDVATLQQLIKDGADVNEDSDGMTPLMLSADNGHVEAIQVLLDANASINAIGKNGATALMCAALQRHLKAIRSLANRGALLDSKTTNNWTALGVAARYGDIDVIQVLLELGAKIDLTCDCGRTPLMYAAKNNQVEAIRLLVKLGANINATDEEGTTPLMFAAQAGKVETIMVLIELDAKHDKVDNFGYTALMFAVENGHADAVRLLTKLGTNVKDNPNLLILAAKNDHVDVIRLLIELGADVNLTDSNGSTSLMHAAEFGKFRAVKSLIDLGAKTDITNKNNLTALMIAILHFDFQLLSSQDLIEKLSEFASYHEVINGLAVIKKIFGRNLPAENALLSSPSIFLYDGFKNESDVKIVIPRPYSTLTVYSIEKGYWNVHHDEIFKIVTQLEKANAIHPNHCKIIKDAYPELFFEPAPTKEQLKKLFNEIGEIIRKELQVAKSRNKNLLLVAGESHKNINSLLLQIMLLQSAKENGVDNVFAEMSEECFSKCIINPTEGTQDYSMPYALSTLSMNVIPMDVEGADHVERESYWDKVVINGNNHGVVICGYFHLEYFYRNNLLREKNHIILFDIIGYSDVIRRKMFECDKVDIAGYSDPRRIKYNVQTPEIDYASRLEFVYTSDEVIKLKVDGNVELMSPKEILCWQNLQEGEILEKKYSSILQANNIAAKKLIDKPLVIASLCFLPHYSGKNNLARSSSKNTPEAESAQWGAEILSSLRRACPQLANKVLASVCPMLDEQMSEKYFQFAEMKARNKLT